MTEVELMTLVNRYTEACDDLGAGLFEQTEAETTAKHATAKALHDQIQAEVQRLHAELARCMRVRLSFGDIISNQCIAMQAALIDQHHKGHEAGMVWIGNTLFGPGLIPDIGEALGLSKTDPAQAWFDAKTAECEAHREKLPSPESLAALIGVPAVKPEVA